MTTNFATAAYLTDACLTASTISLDKIEGLLDIIEELKNENKTLREWMRDGAYSAR